MHPDSETTAARINSINFGTFEFAPEHCSERCTVLRVAQEQEERGYICSVTYV